MRLLYWIFPIVLAACTVGPDYTPPSPPKIPSWNDRSARSSNTVSQQTNPDPLWWNGFGDPVLTQVMQQAIAGNLDLQQAVYRIVEARQGEVTARAAGLPTLGATGSYPREQLGLRGLLLSQGVNGEFNRLADARPGQSNRATGLLDQLSQPTNLFQYGLNSSWALDLFGRVRRSEEPAGARTQAQIAATNVELVMLEGQVAQA